MKKSNKKEIEKELKKINPIELISKNNEKKENKENKVRVENEIKKEFHDTSVWKSSGFTPEQIGFFELKVNNLEEFVQTLPSQVVQSAQEDAEYISKSSEKSYISSGYTAEEKKYQTNPDMWPASILGVRRGTNSSSFQTNTKRNIKWQASQDFNQQKQEFERQQEQYRREIQKKSRLPFKREKENRDFLNI